MPLLLDNDTSKFGHEKYENEDLSCSGELGKALFVVFLRMAENLNLTEFLTCSIFFILKLNKIEKEKI